MVEKTSPRDKTCETTVGGWGGAGWQGGHLIASTFWGASMRYNLVPMQGTQVNQGLMKRVENGTRPCLKNKKNGDKVTDYLIRVQYPDNTTVVPDRIYVSMSPTISGTTREFKFNFPNKVTDSKDLKTLQTRMRTAFVNAGCKDAQFI